MEPTVYIDEARQLGYGLEPLFAGFGPKDFYQVELYVCPPKRDVRDPHTVEIHVFTCDFIEKQAGRPRGLIPPCL